MDPLEKLVRDTLMAQAEHAPPDDRLQSAVRTHGGRHRTGWIALAAAAVVIALAVALVVVRHDRTSHRGTTAQPQHSDAQLRLPVLHAVPRPTAPPEGFHRIGYRGITVDVPRSLPVLAVPCWATTSSYLLLSDDRMYSCPAAGSASMRPRFVVVLAPDGSTEPTRLPHVTIAGTRVTVEAAPSEHVTDEILHSVRVAPDPLGCPANLPATLHNPVAGQLVPGRPTAMTWCTYANAGWHVGSYAVPRIEEGGRPIYQLDQLVWALNSLRPHQVHGSVYETDLLRVVYRDGPARLIRMQRGDVTVFSDGRNTVVDTTNSVGDELTRVAR